MKQEAGMRVERSTEVVEFMEDLFGQVGTADNSSCHDIGMAVQIFGAAMQGEIKTPFRRPKIDRACKCIVYYRNEIMGFGKFN